MTLLVAALAWMAGAMVLCFMPPSQLAGYTFAGAAAVLVAWWELRMKASFRGPAVALPAPVPTAPPLRQG